MSVRMIDVIDYELNRRRNRALSEIEDLIGKLNLIKNRLEESKPLVGERISQDSAMLTETLTEYSTLEGVRSILVKANG